MTTETVISADSAVAFKQLKIATFNLFNYLEPPNAYYDFDRIYSAQQWQKKQTWVTNYLQAHQPDIIGFQEVFSVDSLKQLVREQGYQYFAAVDQPQVIDDFIYRSPVVAIASKFPIVEVANVQVNAQLLQRLSLTNDFDFSRKVVRATIDVPHIGLTDCYVVHFKSKRSMFDYESDQNLDGAENYLSEVQTSIIGQWGSAIQRGSEATLLLCAMLEQRKESGRAMLLMGDFNTELTDGVLGSLHQASREPKFINSVNSAVQSYQLTDSWLLFQQTDHFHPSIERKPTHYYGQQHSILDYIMLSEEFDATQQSSVFEVSSYQTYDKQLINPSFDIDGESTDHGVVCITLLLRK